MGTHDSELAIVMEDTRTIPSMMDGQPYSAGHHAATLRRFLWREHLGLLPPQDLSGNNDANAQPPGDCDNYVYEGEENEFVADPLDDQLWERWTGSATRNTDIFRDLFRADPDDCSMFFEFSYPIILPFYLFTTSYHGTNSVLTHSKILRGLQQIPSGEN
jgi:phospholipase D1/2